MKKGHLDDLLTAVGAFKNAAGATIKDVREFLMSLGTRISPTTITKSLKAAARQGLVQLNRRRYYPVTSSRHSQIFKARGRRPRRGKKVTPKCPCFSKARYRTAAKTNRRRTRRRRLDGLNAVEARRRHNRKRRTRRRTFDIEDLHRVESGVSEARRRRRSSRRRRRARRRDIGEDCIKKGKSYSQKSFLGRTIKIEKDLDTSDEQKSGDPHKTISEKREEDLGETKNQNEKSNEDRKQSVEDKNEERKSECKSEAKSGTDKDDNEDQNENKKDESNKSDEDKNEESNSRGQSEDESGTEKDYNEDQDQAQNQNESPCDYMETDDCDYNIYD